MQRLRARQRLPIVHLASGVESASSLQQFTMARLHEIYSVPVAHRQASKSWDHRTPSEFGPVALEIGESRRWKRAPEDVPRRAKQRNQARAIAALKIRRIKFNALKRLQNYIHKACGMRQPLRCAKKMSLTRVPNAAIKKQP